MEKRVCYICKIEKEINKFSFTNKEKNIYKYECKNCVSEIDKKRRNTEEYREKRRLINKEYKEKNKPLTRKYNKINDKDKDKKTTKSKQKRRPAFTNGIKNENLQIPHITRVYGLTEKDYELLLEKQDGKCGICGIKEIDFITNNKIKRKITRFFIDHDHETKIIRGLLCDKCNRGIGLLGDSYESVIKATFYLKKYSL